MRMEVEEKRKRVLTYDGVESYTPYAKESISEDDFFIDIYIDAIKCVDEICTSQKTSKEVNNIIAFCGDRGSGKTSTMYTFSNVLSNEKSKKDLLKYAELDKSEAAKIEFVNGIRIDPSIFDDVHSIFDIVVAQMYQHSRELFRGYFEKLSSDSLDEKKKKENIRNEYSYLQEMFSETYRKLSLLVDTNHVLEREYDFSGDILKLERLGDGLNLKESFNNLVRSYINFRGYCQSGAVSEVDKKIMLIELDDVDLCSNYAYKLVEQVRKYLMVDNVIVLMALKVEQLDMCIQENCSNDYENLLRINDRETTGKILEDIREMSRAYLLKLIPDVRRLDMDSFAIDTNSQIKLTEYGKEENLISYISRSIAECTNVAICDEELSMLINKNLRSVINVLGIVGKLNKYNWTESIDRFIQFIKNSVIWKLEYKKKYDDYRKFINATPYEIHSYANQIYGSNIKIESISEIMNLADNANTIDEKMDAILIRLIYTLKVNQDCMNNSQSYQNYYSYDIWNSMEEAVLTKESKGVPVDVLSAVRYLFKREAIAVDANDFLTSYNANYGKLKSGSAEIFMKLDDEGRKKVVKAIIDLLIYCKVDKEIPLINKVNPNFINNKLLLAWKYYVVNMANFDYFVEKSGIYNLKVHNISVKNKEIIAEVIKNYKKDNELFIWDMEWIHRNPILCDYINKYAQRRGDYREGVNRTYKSVERFMRFMLEASNNLKDQLTIPNYSMDKLLTFNSNVKKDSIVIQRYVDFIEKCKYESIKPEFDNFPIRFNEKQKNYTELIYRLEKVVNNLSEISNQTNIDVSELENRANELMSKAIDNDLGDEPWSDELKVEYTSIAKACKIIMNEVLKDEA